MLVQDAQDKLVAVEEDAEADAVETKTHLNKSVRIIYKN
jgi:hypothetical protein